MKKNIVIFLLSIQIISCRSNYYVTIIENNNGSFYVINSRDTNIRPDSNIIPFRYKSLNIKIKKEELFLKFKIYKVNHKEEKKLFRYKLEIDSTDKINIKLLERKIW